jgi:hypothetical protein
MVVAGPLYVLTTGLDRVHTLFNNNGIMPAEHYVVSRRISRER